MNHTDTKTKHSKQSPSSSFYIVFQCAPQWMFFLSVFQYRNISWPLLNVSGTNNKSAQCWHSTSWDRKSPPPRGAVPDVSTQPSLGKAGDQAVCIVWLGPTAVFPPNTPGIRSLTESTDESWQNHLTKADKIARWKLTKSFDESWQNRREGKCQTARGGVSASICIPPPPPFFLFLFSFFSFLLFFGWVFLFSLQKSGTLPFAESPRNIQTAHCTAFSFKDCNPMSRSSNELPILVLPRTTT